MIKKLRVANFKCFEDTGELELAPLTLLVGPNSSGKSSIIQALVLIKQTLESGDVSLPAALKGDLIDLGSYPDVVFRHNAKRCTGVQVDLDGPHPLLSSLPDRLAPRREARQRMRLGVEWGYYQKSGRVYVQRATQGGEEPWPWDTTWNEYDTSSTEGGFALPSHESGVERTEWSWR